MPLSMSDDEVPVRITDDDIPVVAADERFPESTFGMTENIFAPVPLPLRLVVRLTPDRVVSIARLLRGAVMPGLVSHVFALRALFPDAAGSDDPNVAEALALERDALRSVLDRLYVKMRIPGYGVTVADCEDVTARRSLTTLLQAVADHRDRGPSWIVDPVLSAHIDPHAAHALNRVLPHAPLGAPEALHAVATLLPRSCDDDPILAGALECYVTLLQDAFANTIGLAPETFDELLSSHADRDLDAARDGLLRALDARVPVQA
jgi:hypothetical protein